MRDNNAVLMNQTVTGNTTSSPFLLTPTGGTPFAGYPICAKFDTGSLNAMSAGGGSLNVVVQGLVGGVWITGWTMPTQYPGAAPFFYEYTAHFIAPQATEIQVVVTVSGTTPSIPVYVSPVTSDVV